MWFAALAETDEALEVFCDCDVSGDFSWLGVVTEGVLDLSGEIVNRELKNKDGFS